MQEPINNQSMLKVGTILRGIYRIDSYLSSGGFGNTYVATNIEFDERVAVKEFFMKGVTQRDGNQTTVSVSNMENQESFLQQREKFKKEARRLRQLSNLHIVKVHDLFEENGTAYYVMDYVDGENLAERLRRTGKPMTETEVNQILPQILDALKSVHDADIWHLDLKPANIMLEKGGNIKLIDFGASKQLNAQKGGATTSTAISYTNGYAPREQMEQNYDKFGPWTDIYALGATLYSLLTNKRPPLPTDIDDDISEDKHLALPMPNVSDAMKSLVLWMMNTNRMQRPQHVGAILEKVKGGNDTIKSDNNVNTTVVSDNDEETIIASDTKETAKRQETITPESSRPSNTSTEDDNSNSSFIIKFIFVVVAVVVIIILLNNGCDNQTVMVDDVQENKITSVERQWYDTPLGSCLYSGPVDDNQKPHGRGEAFFGDGRYYKGAFHHGTLEGKDAYFKYANGDVFEGEFRNNAFYFGQYTIAQDKSYFIGYYKNGQPNGGTWYDKNGKVIE